MPASRSSRIVGGWLLVFPFLKLLKNPGFRVGAEVEVLGGTIVPRLSSSALSDIDSTLRMSERLWMVVEQLICPPR